MEQFERRHSQIINPNYMLSKGAILTRSYKLRIMQIHAFHFHEDLTDTATEKER